MCKEEPASKNVETADRQMPLVRGRAGAVGSSFSRRDWGIRILVLGLVAAAHLVSLMWLVRPLSRAVVDGAQEGLAAATMHLDFVQWPKAASPSLVHPPAARHDLPHHPVRIAASRQAAVVLATANAMPRGSAPAATTSFSPADSYHGYRPGDFEDTLRAARSTMSSRLPGIDTPVVSGMQMRSAPSVRDIAHALTQATRCSAEHFKMQGSTTQFITAQLMDRALEADGCGAHADRGAGDATVDADSHRAIFGD